MEKPTFLLLSRNNRLSREMDLQMAEGHAYTFARDYSYIEVPLWKMLDSDGELVEKASRNQYVELVSAASLKMAYGMKCLVVPNPALYRFGIVPSMMLVDGDTRQIITVPITLRKDLRTEALEYLARIYLFS